MTEDPLPPPPPLELVNKLLNPLPALAALLWIKLRRFGLELVVGGGGFPPPILPVRPPLPLKESLPVLVVTVREVVLVGFFSGVFFIPKLEAKGEEPKKNDFINPPLLLLPRELGVGVTGVEVGPGGSLPRRDLEGL